MSTLREEINKELVKSAMKIIYDKRLDPFLLDKIMSKIEKRIDSTIQDIKRDIEVVSKSDLKYQPNLDILLHHIYNLKEMLND
jgi:hypothetical protein